jgi:hypothetical protein
MSSEHDTAAGSSQYRLIIKIDGETVREIDFVAPVSSEVWREVALAARELSAGYDGASILVIDDHKRIVICTGLHGARVAFADGALKRDSRAA